MAKDKLYVCTNKDCTEFCGNSNPKRHCSDSELQKMKNVKTLKLGDSTTCSKCGRSLRRIELLKPWYKRYIIPLLLVLAFIGIGCYLFRKCCNEQPKLILELSKTDCSLQVGATDTLRAIIHEGDSVIWEVTEGKELVSVVGINDSVGVVTAKKEGEKALVVASLKYNPEVKDSCVYNVIPAKVDEEKDTTSEDTLKVKEPEIQLSLNKSSLAIEVGKSATLVATVQPSKFASEVIWYSESSSIAFVSSTGVVTGKSKGTAKVTAEVKGKKVEAVVTVVVGPTPPPPPPCLDLGYAEYCGPTKVVNGKRVPHGLGGDLEYKRNYDIDLKKASGEIVSVKKGDRMRNCKFDNGRLVQGLIVFSNGEQRWITIGS